MSEFGFPAAGSEFEDQKPEFVITNRWIADCEQRAAAICLDGSLYVVYKRWNRSALRDDPLDFDAWFNMAQALRRESPVRFLEHVDQWVAVPDRIRQMTSDIVDDLASKIFECDE